MEFLDFDVGAKAFLAFLLAELSVSDQISGIEQFSFDLKVTAVEVNS